MKYALLLVVAALAACSGKAKTDAPPVEDAGFRLRGEGRAIPPLTELALRDVAPEATVQHTLGTTTEYRIGDLRVIHKHVEANAVVVASVYVLGGASNVTSETSGIESFAMSVATSGGTEQTPKDAFNAQLDRTGSAIYAFSVLDYSAYSLKTLASDFDANWELFTQAILSPAMLDEDVEIRRTQQLAAIAAMKDSPDEHVAMLSQQVTFANHPYQHFSVGTAENVASFTRDELLAYQRAMLAPANMAIVVVGNVDGDTLIAKIRASFGRLEPTRVAPIEVPAITSEPGATYAVEQIATNYMLGAAPAPALGHPDYPAMMIATDTLRERLFEEVRTKRNLTYAVSSGLSDHRTNYTYLYTTATDPEVTLGVIFDEVEKLRTVPLTEQQLAETVNVFVTEHYMGLETNGSQANALAEALLIGGDWRTAEQMLAKIRAVTPADVQRVAQQYLTGYRFAVVGPRSDLDASLFK